MTVVEVGPRDGLQNEKARGLDRRQDRVRRPAERGAGLPVIEVSAFVSPKWVPQMADAAEVFAGIVRRPGTRYTALVPNLAGLERAMPAGVTEIAVFAAASETFSRKNINQRIDESLAGYKAVCERALAAGLRVRGYLSTAFGCPYEGAVPAVKVIDVTERLLALGVFEVAVSDTIGVAHPGQVRQVLEDARRESARATGWRCTSTTRAGRRWPTCSPRCPSASRRSTRRPAGWAAARTRRARPATWPPRI